MEIFDAHFHIIDSKFPLIENNGYLPKSFVISDYLNRTKLYDIIGGTVVSGSFQAYDYSYILEALELLGDPFFGVINVSKDIKKQELEKLKHVNIAGVRFNLRRSGFDIIDNMVYLSDRLYDEMGWHSELYVDSKDLKLIRNQLKGLKSFSIDHLGLSKEGLSEIYYWIEKGMKIKVTGFGRLNFDPIPVIQTIHKINPNALMFGTDSPSTRSKILFSDWDVKRIKKQFSSGDQYNIFYKNAYNWYNKKAET